MEHCLPPEREREEESAFEDCSVAPRKSPVSPPARRRKRTAQAAAVRRRPRAGPRAVFPRSDRREGAAEEQRHPAARNRHCEGPAPAIAELLAPSGDTEGKSAIIHTGGSRASDCVSTSASGAAPASAERRRREEGGHAEAAAPKLPMRLSRRMTNSCRDR